MGLLQASDESKVLVLNTGGTINMILGQEGYVPEPNFLMETLYSQHRFHDPLEQSLFSHASSVEAYRQWSTTSGTTTPTESSFGSRASSPAPLSDPGQISAHRTLMLPVRSSRPIGLPVKLAAESQHSPHMHRPVCTKTSEGVYEAYLPSLITPRSSAPGGHGKRVRYVILEWHPLLDSSNIEPQDWIHIATDIELNYPTFDAFVILHGTDTMSYTTSALSFMLEDLGKTVIVTGAQIPLSQLRNDAVDNLLGALVIAGHYIIPECCLFFNHSLFRGNRVSKLSSYDLDAFDSPNFPPLVKVGIDIDVNWNDVIRQTSLRRFKAHKDMSPFVATLRLFPGITAATLRAFMLPPTRGVVLETFGSGNAPQRPELMAAFKEACDRGIVIVAITQCSKGSVSDAYETGRSLATAGVVSGGDMTPECALTKLSYLLSKPELSVEQIRSLIGMPLRGELTRPSTTIPPSLSQQTAIDQSLENIFGILSQVVRLTTSKTMPNIVISTPDQEGPSHNASQEKAMAGAPWSWTAAEAASMEGSLFPTLMHLAVARDDAEGVSACLSAEAPLANSGTAADTSTFSPSHDSNSESRLVISGGIVNCADPTSGHSPLHAAALNGSMKCLNILLEAGALVHVRDVLGHTPLYYAARQKHEDAVDVLVKAGAILGGSDIDGGFVDLAVQRALVSNDESALRVWKKAGARISSTSHQRDLTKPIEM